MSYQSLYRRYRPRRFGEVKGQQHVVAALHNAVRESRVGHAYLLSGPRGTGKTTCARILAKALNCEHPVDGEPCLECASCAAIEAGTSFDLHELDAASNNGVDAMRELINRAGLGSPGRTKVYILDEVHMLSPGASNALLKTLEEPPDHVVFVLATTDPQKVLPTIRSRTQHFELHLIPADELEAHLHWVIADAGLEVSEEELAHVLRVGGGSARDTLSALDQVVAAGGIDDRAASAEDLLAGLLERDPGAVLAAVHAAVASGREPRVLGEALVGRLRDAFLASVGVPLDHLPEVDRARVAELVDGVDRPFLTRALDVLGTALVEMRQAADPRITLETALVRLADVTADTSTAALLERVERLERALAGGAVPAAPVVATSAAPGATVDPPSAGPAAAPSTPAPPRAPGGSPADEARRKLADRAGASAARPAPSRPAPAPPRPPTSASSASPVADGSAPAPATPPSPATSTGPAPTVEALTAALAALAGSAKARYQGGRFVEVVDGTATFALPNEIHRQRCDDLRAEVEATLASRLGRPITLRLVVDAAGSAAPADDAGPPARSPQAEEHIDLDDLVDAPAEPVRTGAEKLVEAFPGAELVEEDRT